MTETTSLSTVLLAPARRPRLMADCKRLLDDEVASRRGLRGMALKGAYRTVKAIRPGFIDGVLDVLLDEWIAEMEHDFNGWQGGDQGQSFGAYMLSRRDDVADRMLRVTDRRAEGSTHKTAAKLYWKLRDGAKRQVVEALPRVADLVDRHLA